MKAAAMPRWTVSFADLTLLLLAFFVLLQAGSMRDVAAAARTAFSSEPVPGPLLHAKADTLFEAGEARLTAAARTRLERIAQSTAAPLIVESKGRDPAARRFDGWELAAARAAAVARALSEAGLGEQRVSIILPRERRKEEVDGQSLVIRSGA